VRQHRFLSLIRHLLADHHVYVRSGPASCYVVLAWPWQIGVSLATLGLLGWTGVASYGWLAAHLETLQQGSEIARLAHVNRRLEALVEAAYAPTPVARLVAELNEVKAGGQHASGLSDAAAAIADELRGEPTVGEVEAAVGDGETRMVDPWLADRFLPAAIRVDRSSSGRDWLYDQLARQPLKDAARAAETHRLRAELRAAAAEIDRLKDALRGTGSESEP
jgi:hypothetical protein